MLVASIQNPDEVSLSFMPDNGVSQGTDQQMGNNLIIGDCVTVTGSVSTRSAAAVINGKKGMSNRTRWMLPH